MFLENKAELDKRDIRSTEVKFENSILRTTAIANPRQIERVIRGAVFDLNLIYEVTDEEKVIQDMTILTDGLRMLQYDYLGGSGSRGYGKVKFCELYAEAVIGEVSEEIMDKCNDMLAEF